MPTKFEYEDDTLAIFDDIRPSAPIHLLVVPKVHIQSIAYLEGNHKEIITAIIYAARDMAKKIGLTGYKLVFNVGRDGGQVIDHLHLHILGGWTDRGSIESVSHPKLDK